MEKHTEEFTWQPYRHAGGKARVGKKGQLLKGSTFDCAFCNGTGEKPRGSKCSVCRGEGKIKVDPPAVYCAYCHGRGETPPRSNCTCTVCRGKGVVSIQQPVEACAHCRGTGAEPGNKLPCLKCRGKGVVAKK